jgi:hypothetical protein
MPGQKVQNRHARPKKQIAYPFKLYARVLAQAWRPPLTKKTSASGQGWFCLKRLARQTRPGGVVQHLPFVPHVELTRGYSLPRCRNCVYCGWVVHH